MKTDNVDTIRNKLLDITDIEEKQKNRHTFVPDIPASSTRIRNNQLELLNNYFFKKQELLYISKHNRFAAYPLHSHQFTELNYVLSGSCRQIVNGDPITLRQGELLLIGTGASHKIETLHEDDLLINILFKINALPVEWMNQMRDNQDPLIRYLFDISLEQGHTDRYIIFNVSEAQNVQHVLKQMITEYYSATPYSIAVSTLYLPILFTLLARQSGRPLQHSAASDSSEQQKNKLAPVLQMIDENYKTTSLAEIADQLGYNKTYLGNLIKKTLGVSFTRLVIKRRLYQARLLLNVTDLPISDIARESGFSNITYFYKVFKETFGYLPSKERNHS